MRTEVIKADTIDVAVERILVELRADTTSSRENAIYFDGWDGLGASAVLQDVAKRLAVSNEPSTRPAGLEFEKIIHIDCSKWESRRAMQREIAEQLDLPNWVMEMFDKQDEEDDFDGLDQSSRTEIAQVVREIYQTTQNRRFLVILHNGSSEEIDILDFGLSLDRYANSKLVWTFQGRFRIDPKMIESVKKSTSTDVVLSASGAQRDPHELWSYLVRHEAAQVFCNKYGHGIIDPVIAAECVLYMLKQCHIGSLIVDYDWAIHASNYWICDGIIALTDTDKAWKIGNVLQSKVRLLDIENQLNIVESTTISSSHLARSTEHMPYWISTTTCGFVLSPSGAIADSMFRHSHELGVLKLSRCTFSFLSPPFLCCHSLRFLWLEHCEDLLTRRTTTHNHQSDVDKEEQEMDKITTASWECFQSLWVLDLRYTDWDQILSARVMDLMTQLRELNVVGAKNWDMSHLQGRLRNIRKLRVTKSTCFFNNNVFSEMESMELLDFSGNHVTQGMTCLSVSDSNSSLKTITIGGCDELTSVTFRHCKELKNLFLKGSLFGLEELELSGTRVKTLDLRGVGARSLPKRIILLGCENLCAILWPLNLRKQELPEVLHIDTMSPATCPSKGDATLVHPHPDSDRSLYQQKEEYFKDGWKISLTDTRLLRSLSSVRSYFENLSLHIDICPAANVCGSNIQGTSSNDKLVQVRPHASTFMGSKYRDALREGAVSEIMMRDCPEIFIFVWTTRRCIIKVGQGNKLLENASGASTRSLLMPGFIFYSTTSLHMYDNPAITSVPTPPQGSAWYYLRWCRIERCPKLHTTFTAPQGSSLDGFYFLSTLWVSQLLSALYIWDKQVKNSNFHHLNFLHMDHCPRLVHVLPFSTLREEYISEQYTLYSLQTLEIVSCGDLREVFPLSPQLQEQDKIKEFPKLRRIHLHELPMLQRICGRRMSAPNLETIKIRGCWSLRRLPVVGHNTKPPKVDCEKEWWDNLEWDGLDKNHHPSLYEPIHSLYYKAQLPRGTVLR